MMIFLSLLSYAVLLLNFHAVQAQFASTRNFWPANYPLAVRSPYLNCWQTSTNGTTTLQNWPLHWNDGSIMGWAGMVRVDTNRTYQWLGGSGTGNATSVRRSTITPTRSIFEVVAGPVLLNVTFLSPIEPSDPVKQSLPFIYIAVNVTSLDGNSHDVQLYSDISAEWISGDRTNIATWNMSTTSAASYHEIGRQVPDALQETSNIAEDSKAYYAMATRPSMTLQSGQDLTVRGQFVSQGTLTGAQDTSFRAIQTNWPVFGISVDLGTVTADVAGPVVWALGLVRDPVVSFTTGSAGSQQRNAYFWSQYSTIADAINAFVNDYSNALVRAEALDEKIMGDAEQVSDDYVDLVSLGARQAMAVDVTIARGSDGQWNMSDVKTFLKDVGNSGRVNPMEVIYAAFPIYLYLNATLAGTLLAPILEYQGSPAYTSNFAAADLGTQYPLASSDSVPAVNEGIQNSGYILIMVLAHAQAAGDGSLAGKYYSTLSKWADYLVQNSLAPDSQVTNGVSETNLALNGILGVKAMSVISEAAGRSDDAARYQGNATSLIQQWTTQANASGHISASYSGSSSALIYSLYADKMLNLSLVDSSVYTAQSQYYNSLDGAVFGLPLITSNSTARSDWTMFTAGSVSDSGVRNKLATMVRSRAGSNLTAGAFPVAYDDSTGEVVGGLASPGQGAMFSLLALNLTHQSFTVNAPSSGDHTNDNHHSGTSAGVIAGATIASVVGVALLALLAFWLCRRQRRRAAEEEQNTRPTPLDTATPVWPAATTGTFSSSTPNVHQSPKYSTTTGTGTGQRGWQSTEGLAGPSSPPPSTYNQSSSGAYSEAQLLRGEVENLRRDMQQLRAEGMLPPEYGL